MENILKHSIFIGTFWWERVGGESVLASRLVPSAPFFNRRPAMITYGRVGAAAPPQLKACLFANVVIDKSP
jgi:hypothetical protein